MDLQQTPAIVRDAVEAVTQCVLRLDKRSIRIAKAEGRADGVRGSVLYWQEQDGKPRLSSADLVGRVAASLRAVRRAHGLTQQDLARLAGVTASAISQAERGERSLSLATMVRLSAAVGTTIDDLLRGEEPNTYRIGRLSDDQALEQITTLIGDSHADLRVDLIHLEAHQATQIVEPQRGVRIIAVASGLIQVQMSTLTPTVRRGEVLVANKEQIKSVRNLGSASAMLFWIVLETPSDMK
jgi:transcriptional regulator with XRE-family HTH domain